MSTRVFKPICISLPPALLEWVDAEARAMEMNRSQFIQFGLFLQRSSQLEPELRALRIRVEALERESLGRKEWPQNPDSIAPVPVRAFRDEPLERRA